MRYWQRITRKAASIVGTVSLLFGMAMATGLGAPPAAASGVPSGVGIYVGYADSVHATAAFPVPWQGDPGVTFEGCTGTCSFDAGAVMIANNSTASITVNSLSVVFLSPDNTTCTFSFWPSNVTVGIGGEVIYTQTATGASSGCPEGTGLMDSSDIGPDGTGWVGQCTNSGVIPEVEATINGVTTTSTDSGQVLNTGGIDKAECSGGPSEAEQWTTIGGNPCPNGATVTLKPTTQTFDEGGTATVVATVDNGCGSGIPGVPVTFTRTGTNAGTSTINTDTNGDATLTYSDTSSGADTITASFTSLAGTFTSNSATVTWTDSAPVVTVTSPGVVAVNTSATFTGSFTDLGSAVDTYTATWDWGDGSPNTVQSGVTPSTTLSASHAYTAVGVYPVTLTVTDEEGQTGSATADIAVFNPSGGFVTGGGWINSGAGSCSSGAPSTCTAATAGKAEFGFVSRYQQGATTPSGQTQFQFQAGGLNFHSSAYSLLIVQGTSGFAQYDGSGTLNGTSGDTFQLTAYDHDISNSAGTVDGIRMQIWNSSGALVYDNCGASGACTQSGSLGGMATGNTQPLGGGDIVIHGS